MQLKAIAFDWEHNVIDENCDEEAPRHASNPSDSRRLRSIAAPPFAIGALGEYSSCASIDLSVSLTGS